MSDTPETVLKPCPHERVNRLLSHQLLISPGRSTVSDVPVNDLRALLAALETLEARVKVLEEALRDLAEASRNACDARLCTSLTDALATADYLLLKQLSGDGS